MATLLVIDDDRSIRETLELAFMKQGHVVVKAASGAEGKEKWKQSKPEVILLDLILPDCTGLELLHLAREENLSGIVILITGHQDLEQAVEAMKAGAFDYIHKPLNIDELELAVERALSQHEHRRKLALVADLASQRSDEKIVGKSAAIIDIHKKIGLASRGKANVLITGESGTGKELVARAIHKHTSPDEPFIPVNCSAFVATLLESELFGHEKGAFTGAIDSRPGRFELAEEGTVFLDEIGDLDLALQVKLLRILQERTFARVGGARDIHFNARIITATHRDLATMIKDNLFREDLYYRLKVVEIHIPPLREHKEDIEPLVEDLLVRINRKLRRNVSNVSQEMMDALKTYNWPGNVRELENRLTAGIILSPGTLLQVELPKQDPPEFNTSTKDVLNDWNQSLNALEKWHIGRVLTACSGNLGKTCEVLEISRPTLRRKMKEYNLTLD